MKLFPAKCHEWATLRKLWRQTGNSSLLTAVACNGWNRGAVFKFCFCFVLVYNKSLNDWSLGEQWILLIPSNVNVSLDFVSENIEILWRQNSLFPSGPVIKCFQNGNFILLWWSTRCFWNSFFNKEKTFRIKHHPLSVGQCEINWKYAINSVTKWDIINNN